MSWGTDFNVNLYISRECFNSKEEVSMRIDEVDSNLYDIRRRLSMIAIADPRILLEKDETDLLYSIDVRMRELMEQYEEDVILKYKLELLYDNWKDEYKPPTMEEIIKDVQSGCQVQ